MKLVKEIIKGVRREAAYFLKVNVRYFASLLNLALPYFMYVAGQCLAVERGGIAVGAEIIVPVVCVAVAYFMRESANWLGTGDQTPVPAERFTEIDEEGVVSVANERLQELLLYVADIEDYLERKGRM